MELLVFKSKILGNCDSEYKKKRKKNSEIPNFQERGNPGNGVSNPCPKIPKDLGFLGKFRLSFIVEAVCTISNSC